MTDQSIYHAQNLCKHTGLERLARERSLPNGHVFRAYRDSFNQWRGVLFKSKAHRKGYAGLVVDAGGTIAHREVCPAMRDCGAFETLAALLRAMGITVRDS